ncbi:MAG: hypothetical protein FJ253_08365 [Phycisphaerae bacterium]|nr:hypothetical protein [Phycisphaerae bacterium]
MLRWRLITGTLLIAALVALGAADEAIERTGRPPGGVIGAAIVLVVIPLMAIELTRLLRGAGLGASLPLSLVAAWGGLVATAGIPLLWQSGDAAGAAASGASAAWMPSPDTATISITALAAVAFLFAGASRQPRGAAGTVGSALIVFVLAGVLPGYWLRVRVDYSMPLFVGAILVVKVSDMAAYFGGRLAGRNKLIPWLSPGKTWEGAIIGVAASGAAAAALALLGEGRLGVPSPGWAAVVGIVLGIAGLFGDLAESLLKREAGVKDSGRILPGMGGMLDLLDSLLFAGPLAWLLLRR